MRVYKVEISDALISSALSTATIVVVNTRPEMVAKLAATLSQEQFSSLQVTLEHLFFSLVSRNKWVTLNGNLSGLDDRQRNNLLRACVWNASTSAAAIEQCEQATVAVHDAIERCSVTGPANMVPLSSIGA